MSSGMIVIFGPKGSGKDTLAEKLMQTNSRFAEKRAFATPIKQFLIELCGVEERFLYDPKLKNEYSNFERDEEHRLTYRELMQQVGGKMREIDNSFWIKCMQQTLSPHLNIIVDGRHRNEWDWAQSQNAFTVLLTRNANTDPHLSERDLDGMSSDLFNIVVPENFDADQTANLVLEKYNEWLAR